MGFQERKVIRGDVPVEIDRLCREWDARIVKEAIVIKRYEDDWFTLMPDAPFIEHSHERAVVSGSGGFLLLPILRRRIDPFTKVELQ